MINQFLKVGGVATLKDFYQKFPTQAHFDHYVQMKYGGINAYANGGSYRTYQGDVGGSTVTAPPRRGDYMDNEEQYQADMDAYTQSLGTGPSNNAVVGKDGMTQFIRRPEETAPAATASTPATAAPSSSYQGVSIVDMLNAEGLPSDKASRKAMAEQLGITGYTGTAAQNRQLIEARGGKFAGGAGSSSGGGGRKKLSKPSTNFYDDMLHEGETMEEMYARQAKENPYVMAPGNQPSQNPFGTPTFPGGQGVPGQPNDDDGNSPWPWIAGGAGAAALGYGAYKKFGKKGAAAMQELKQLGYSAPEAMKLLEYNGGLPSGPNPMKMIGNGANTAVATNDLKIINDITQRGAYTVDELKLLKKTNPEAALKLSQTFPKFVKGTKTAASPAASVVKQATTAGNKTNTAAATAEKVTAAAPGYFEAAGNWLKNAGSGAKNAIKEGVTAAKEAKAVKDAMRLYKFFGKIRGLEEGGESDDLDMLHHYYKLNYLQNGGYMNDGGYMDDGGYMNDGEGSYAYGGHYLPHAQEGNEGDWSIGSWHVPNWLKTTAQVVDPTGISSWGDAGRAMKEAYNNPGWGSIGNAALETLGALPIIGKVGKAAKVAKAAAEGQKVSKLAKATQMVTKPIKAVANARVPYTQIKPFKAVQQIDNYLPFQKITGAIPTKIISKAPGAVQTAVKIGNDAQRFKRWNKGAQGILGGIGVTGDPSTPSGSTNYAHGGYYGNVPQHGNPGVYSDGYSGTSSGGQYFQQGGAFVPSYGDSAYGLPQYDAGASYQEGGMAPEGMAPQGAPQQGPPQQPSEGGGIDPQQVMQEVAQMLQQGAQPDQIMQQLVQEGIPQDVAQQIIQQVMQQMQGGQEQAPPQQRYGGRYAKGGISAGQEMDVSPEQMEALRQQGYKFDII